MRTDTRPARRRPGDEKILAALASGHPYSEAARIAKVSSKTVQRRMADPLFRVEVEELRARVVQQTAASLATLATKACATLEPLLNDGEPWMRQKTALAVIELSIRYRETLEFSDRLALLEQHARELVPARELIER
jgi:hypothetical protein